MIKNVDIKTTIQDYKKNKENDGKIAIYHIATSKVIFEGNEEDWAEMQDKVEEGNKDSELYYLIIVPHSGRQIRAFSWR